MTSPVESTASDVIPRSTPTTEAGRVGTGSCRWISTDNEQNQRPPRWVTVADRTRAVPRSTWRASVRADSWVRTTPIRGNRTCLRSRSTRPKLPVVKRQDIARRLPLSRGNRTFDPRRAPVFDTFRLPSATARFARPLEYASFEFSGYHGAMSSLVRFHRLRRANADHAPPG